ncbi:sensor histidine kinase [Tannockella kyphosi]|uniref:sensor histidine kinase n=1 Tax=Tannockella kyphosi TaxID=2899121 RepID=UPI002011FB6C|nr:sensor histidine kinase [Tannockella kyphosi]
MGKRKIILIINGVLFLGLVIFTYGTILTLLNDDSISISDKNEIAYIDFSTEVVELQSDIFEWYPSVLYTSEDFEYDVIAIADDDALYGTYRVTLDLEEGETYMIAGQSADYAQNVWINGELLSQVGVVSDNVDDFVAEKTEYSITFVAGEEEVEIIIQSAYFNHVNGAVESLYLGDPDLVVDLTVTYYMHETYILGALASIGLFFIGMYAFYYKDVSLLFFGLACFAVSLKTALYGNSIMLISPSLNWYLGHRLEWISVFAYFFCLFMYLDAVFHWMINKIAMIIGLSILVGLSMFYMVTPSYIYSSYLSEMVVVLTLTILFLLANGVYTFIKYDGLKTKTQFLTLLSVILLSLAAGLERLLYPNIVINILAPTTLVVIFINAIIFTFSFTNTDKQLFIASQKEAEINSRNNMLENLNLLKNDYMNTIAHELKTPLAVITGYSQLTQLQINENKINEETIANLKTISNEAMRLSNLVSKLLTVTLDAHSSTEKTKQNLYQLIEEMSTILKPILVKKGNIIINDIEADINVRINYEMILQVYINLAVNANRHSKSSVITFSNDSVIDNRVLVRVVDTGTGISEEILPHIFEKGFSHDGSSGLGLAICRDIVEMHKGELQVEKTGPLGTSFAFTLPIYIDE